MNMTPREAFELAEAIVKTWPSGPKQSAWSTFLQERCQCDPAWETFRQHRDTDERPPSVAGFLATYRRNAGEVRIGGQPCAACEGTGWRTARQVIGAAEHTVVVACADCGAGRTAVDTLRRIDEHNARENTGARQSHGPVIAAPLDTNDGPVMSFAEYLSLLARRMGNGDTDAGQMLDVWQQNLERGAWTP